MTTIDDQEYYDVYWLRIYFHLFRYLYDFSHHHVFSCFLAHEVSPYFSISFILRKNIYFSIMVGIMEFLESLSCSDLQQVDTMYRQVYWVGIVLMVHLLMITLITIQLSIVTTVYNAVHSSVFVLHTSLETIDARICIYVLYYNIMLFFLILILNLFNLHYI